MKTEVTASTENNSTSTSASSSNSSSGSDLSSSLAMTSTEDMQDSCSAVASLDGFVHPTHSHATTSCSCSFFNLDITLSLMIFIFFSNLVNQLVYDYILIEPYFTAHEYILAHFHCTIDNLG